MLPQRASGNLSEYIITITCRHTAAESKRCSFYAHHPAYLAVIQSFCLEKQLRKATLLLSFSKLLFEILFLATRVLKY